MATASSGEGVEDRLESYHFAPGAFLFASDTLESTPQADDKGRYRADEGEASTLTQKRLHAAREATAVQYVERTREAVVLSDAAREARWISDPYVVAASQADPRAPTEAQWAAMSLEERARVIAMLPSEGPPELERYANLSIQEYFIFNRARLHLRGFELPPADPRRP